MKNRVFFGLVAIAFWFAVCANPLDAEANNLAVTITRPGEGEQIYTGPGAPYVCVPVTGWVTADQIDVTRVQVKLELYQSNRTVGSLTTNPAKDGKYWFDVAINDNNPDDHPVAECASGACHIFSSLGFPAGRVLVRVTATDSLGRKAVAERSVVVDHSGSANVPVQVIVTGASNSIPPGVNLTAQTRLYEWRARQYIASTDTNGRALFNVEELGQAPTRYIFRLDPIVVDGVQYASREPAQLTLNPNVPMSEPVKLVVEARRGQINATLKVQNKPLQASLTVRAIELSSGLMYSAKTSDGKVTLSNLAISKYLVGVDGEEAASWGLQSQPRTMDLTEYPITSTVLVLAPATTRIIRGTVRDNEGKILPVAWLALEESGEGIRTSPLNGEFISYGLANEVSALWVAAPGYYRRLVALDSDRLDIALTREPETRSVSWGNGTLTVPPESLAEITGNRIALRRGWLWGNGTGTFTITTPDAGIDLSGGTFALESLLDAPSWLYVIDGQAQVHVQGTNAKITMNAGQMLAFGHGVARPIPVVLDGNAVRALHADEVIPVRIGTDLSPWARVRDKLARIGFSVERMLIVVGLILGGTLILGVKRRGVSFR